MNYILSDLQSMNAYQQAAYVGSILKELEKAEAERDKLRHALEVLIGDDAGGFLATLEANNA